MACRSETRRHDTAVTRDYAFGIDTGTDDAKLALMLSVFGDKIMTRRLHLSSKQRDAFGAWQQAA